MGRHDVHTHRSSPQTIWSLSMTYFEKEIEAILKISDFKTKYERFFEHLYIYIDGQHSDVVINLIKQFIEESESKTELGYGGVFCSSLAYIYLGLGDKPMFQHYIDLARQKSANIKTENGRAMYLTHESIFSWFAGKRNDGFDYIFKGIKAVENTEYHDESGWCHYTLATYQFDSNLLKEAEENYLKALSCFKKTGSKYGYARANNGLASVKIKQGKLEEASKILNEIKDIYLFFNKLSGLSRTLTDLGAIEFKLGHLKEALQLHEEAYQMRIEIINVQGQITSLLEMGEVLVEMKNYSEAEKKLTEAANLSSQNNIKAKAYRAHNLLAKLYKQTEQFEKAMQHLEKYFEFKTQVLADESTSRIKVLQTQLLAEEASKRAEIEQESNKELRKAYAIIEQKNTEIVQSIDYAKRIQKTILPGAKALKESFPKHFVFYRPKDIVAGDFYWMHVKEKKIFFAVCDSTGHGVPGALVSLVCNQALNRAVAEFDLEQPAQILDKVNEMVIEAFSGNEHEDVNDGMDASFLMVDFENKRIEWAGANNPLWILDKKGKAPQLSEIKGNKQPIGKYDFIKPFTNHQMPLIKGNNYYLFSDGFVDQFGGPNTNSGGKKFSPKKLRELILSLSGLDINNQEQKFENAFLEWKGEMEQIDDVLVAGVSF